MKWFLFVRSSANRQNLKVKKISSGSHSCSPRVPCPARPQNSPIRLFWLPLTLGEPHEGWSVVSPCCGQRGRGEGVHMDFSSPSSNLGALPSSKNARSQASLFSAKKSLRSSGNPGQGRFPVFRMRVSQYDGYQHCQSDSLVSPLSPFPCLPGTKLPGWRESKKSCLLLRLSPSCGRCQASLCISSSRMGWENSKLKKKMQIDRYVYTYTHTHVYT